MSQTNEGLKSFEAGGAIAKYLRVNFSSGKLAAAGATAADIGTITEPSFASGDIRTVQLLAAPGTAKVVAAGAVTQGAKVYTAASGKVSATQATGAFLRGIALEAAAADGDVIEIIPLMGDTAGS